MRLYNLSIKATRRADAECLVNLTQRRRWFTENPNGGTTTPPAGQPGGTGSSSAGTQNSEHMIPKSRLDEALQRAVDAEAKLTQFQTESQQREQARLQEQGQFKELAETRGKEVAELTPYKTRAEQLETMMREGNEARIKQVSEANQPLIPTDYPPEKLAAWLDNNWQRLIGTPAPNIDAGAGEGRVGASTALTDEEKATAKQFGLSDKEYADAKTKVAAR